MYAPPAVSRQTDLVTWSLAATRQKLRLGRNTSSELVPSASGQLRAALTDSSIDSSRLPRPNPDHAAVLPELRKLAVKEAAHTDVGLRPRADQWVLT